jgi:transcription elongation factor S-II
MSAVQTVLNLKEVIEKEVQSDGGNMDSPSSTERCSDVLKQLNSIQMTYDILNETLIGATVNKLKKHATLGATAKDLIKSWKQVVATTISSSNEKPKAATTSSTVPQTKSPPTERRSSLESSHNEEDDADGNGSTYDPTTEWETLSSQRQNVCQKLYNIFVSMKLKLMKDYGVNERALINLLGPRTLEMEAAIHDKFKTDLKGYADKARSLIFNLSKNSSLSISIVLGHVEPVEIMSYTTEQLASEETRMQRQQTAQRLIDSKRLDWNEANEDKINNMCGIKGDLLNASLFTCGRCKSIKTTSTQKQTRSADEPMTVFVLCLNCGKRWKC